MDILSYFGIGQKQKVPKKNPLHVTYQDSTSGFGNYATYNSSTAYQGDTSAMKLSTVYRSVEIISDSISMLPIDILKKGNKDFKEPFQHPIRDILRRPNPVMSTYQFFKLIISQMILKGNAYIHILRSDTGHITSLVPLNPESITPLFVRSELVYRCGNVDIPNSDIIHIRNFTYDGLNGISTLRHALNSLELASDSERMAQNYFKGGGNMQGILKHNGILREEQKQAIKTGWSQAYSGNGNGIAILDGQFDFQSLNISNADSQLLETRRFNCIDLCRFFGVSPSKCFEFSTGASYSSLDHASMSFLKETLQPIITKIEQEFSYKLFPNDPDVSLEFDVNVLLKTDQKSQAEIYTKLIQSGVLTVNEARLEMGYSEYPDPEADKLFLQVNMQSLENFEGGAEDEDKDINTDKQ